MTDFLTTLEKELLICDGAMGTELYARGLAPGENPELWNVSHPERVLDIHRSYLAAGARVVLTNTFGASRFKLEKYGLESRVTELNRAAARVARQACRAGDFVLGDVGPTGELMLPLGTHDRREFVEVFAEQVRALADGGVDGIIIETMTALEEMEAAVEAVRRVAKLPVLCSMQFRRDADGKSLHTMMGVDAPCMAERLQALGADGIGTNCAAPDEIADVLRILLEHSDVPLVAEPNAGVPELVGGKTVFKLGPQEFAEAVAPLARAGVRLLGGCCGTTPAHIRALAAKVGAQA